MASDLDPPLRGEPILDEFGNFTIRYTEFFSRTSVLVNELVNGGSVVNPGNLSNSTVFGAQVIDLQQRVGTDDPLTSDETGFTVDLDTLSVDMTESNPNDLPEGEDGEDGTDGTNGTNGEGVATGGTAGQVLSKIDSTDFNTEWTTPGSGGSVAWGGITGTLSDQTDLQTVLDLKIENLSSFDTGDLSEGSNLYYTEVRVAANSAVTANTAKVTNATHTGDVTGSTALTAQSVMVTGQSTVTAVSGDFVLISDTSDSGNLKKVDASDFLGGGGSVYSFNRLIGATTQAVTSTLTAITWSSSSDSSGSDVTFSGGNPTRLTAVSTGTYKIGGYVTINSAAQRAQAAVEIMINGVATGFQRSGSYIRNAGTGYDYWTMDVSSTPFTLTASDFVELAVGQVTGATYGYGGALTITCDRTVSEFWLERVA